jgi:hypothetical protein
MYDVGDIFWVLGATLAFLSLLAWAAGQPIKRPRRRTSRIAKPASHGFLATTAHPRMRAPRPAVTYARAIPLGGYLAAGKPSRAAKTS